MAGDEEFDDGPGAVGVGEGLVGYEIAEGEVGALVLEEVGPVGVTQLEDGVVFAGHQVLGLEDEVVDAVVDEKLTLGGGAAIEGKAGGR